MLRQALRLLRNFVLQRRRSRRARRLDNKGLRKIATTALISLKPLDLPLIITNMDEIRRQNEKGISYDLSSIMTIFIICS